MSNVRLHQLEGFYFVARLGSYTKAAQAFDYPIGQSAVYQQVRSLQEGLGVRLLVQAGPRRTELTAEGRTLFAFIAPFFEGLPNVIERVQQADVAPIVLAADQFLAMEALPAALVRARASRPGFSVRVEELASKDVIERVKSGTADAGLSHVAALPPMLQWHPLGTVGVALMVPRKHPLARQKSLPPPDVIAQHALIVYEANSSGRMLTERLFRQLGVKLRVAAEATFSQTMRAMARAGVAPAFVPYLRGSGAGKALPSEPGTVAFDITPRLKDSTLAYGLLCRPGMEESQSFRILLESLRGV